MKNLDMIDDHEAIEMLLPWFVTGQLNADEMKHVGAHLAHCAWCRELLAQEHQLKTDFTAIPAAVPYFSPPDISSVETQPSRFYNWRTTRQILSGWVAKPGRPLTFAALQAAILLVMFQLVQPAALPDAEFRTLSSGNVVGVANAIVVFDSNTREADFRSILIGVDATIIGGPTDADAYMLWIDSGKRDSALVKLRSNRQIVLAQPIDQERSQ